MSEKELKDYREQLKRIIKSEVFANAKRSKAFLSYIVNKTLENKENQIKEYSIAVDAFGLSSSFDQQFDPRIRVEAKRLRDRLAQYYAEPGYNDPIRISIPKGSYKPVIEYNDSYRARDIQSVEDVMMILSNGDSLGILTRNSVHHSQWGWISSFLHMELVCLVAGTGIQIPSGNLKHPEYACVQDVFSFDGSLWLYVSISRKNILLSISRKQVSLEEDEGEMRTRLISATEHSYSVISEVLNDSKGE